MRHLAIAVKAYKTVVYREGTAGRCQPSRKEGGSRAKELRGFCAAYNQKKQKHLKKAAPSSTFLLGERECHNLEKHLKTWILLRFLGAFPWLGFSKERATAVLRWWLWRSSVGCV